MARKKKQPQPGRAKTQKKQNYKPQQNKQAQQPKNSVALTIPSPGWTEWMQSGIDRVSNWIFPQQPNSHNDSGTTNTIDATTTTPIQLTELNGTDGVIINGLNAWGNSGVTVAGGNSNIAVGTPFAHSSAGRIDVVSGRQNLQSPISLSDPNAILLSAKGQQRGDFLGSAIVMDDKGVVGSARYANLGNQTWVGKTYSIPSNATGEVDLSSPEVQQFIGMDAEEQSGSALALGYRMVEGVMKRLIIITAPFACLAYLENNCTFPFPGRIYGVYDDPDLPNPFYLADLYDPAYNVNGNKGFVIEGTPIPGEGEQVGGAIAYSGKWDALLIGAGVASPNNSTYAGKAYLLYLNSISSSVFNLVDMNEANGNIFYGPYARAKLGSAVAFAEGFFGNGNDALILGAPWDVIDNATGVVFAVNLGDPNLPSIVDFSNSTALQHAVQFNGALPNDLTGIWVSGAGDSIMIAARIGSAFEAEEPSLTYIVYGGAFSSFSKPFELSSLDGTQGLKCVGGPPNTTTLIDSQCVAATDVDGNGFVDWIISQYTASPNATFPGAGQVYVVYRQAPVAPPSYSAQLFQYFSGITLESLCQTSADYLSGIDLGSVYQASVNGGLRGATRVIEEKLEQQHHSSMVSKSVSELMYALSYAVFNYWHHYNRAIAEGDEVGAAYKAMAETCNDMLAWFTARVFFEGVVAKSFEWVANHASDAGYSRVADWLNFFGNNASTGVYLSSEIIRKRVPGALNAACTLFGGGLTEQVTKRLLRPLLIEKKLDEGITQGVGIKI